MISTRSPALRFYSSKLRDNGLVGQLLAGVHTVHVFRKIDCHCVLYNSYCGNTRYSSTT